MNQYWWIYLNVLISTYLHQWGDINDSNLMSHNPWIYTDGPIATNLHRWVNIDKPSTLISIDISMLKSWYRQINIEQYTPVSQCQEIYTNKLILMNVLMNIDECLWVNINKYMLKGSLWCFLTSVSMLMNLNLQVNIDKSAMTGRYWWICRFKVTLMNLHLWVNIIESRPMCQY